MFGIIIIQFHNKYTTKILHFNIIPAEMDGVFPCSDLNVLLSVLKAVCWHWKNVRTEENVASVLNNAY